MELRHLRYFIRAAELLNFTKAAESLYVSQPTLSVQIHQLEEELGTELFSRVGRNVRLTEAGRTFLLRAQRAVDEIEQGGKEIDAINGLVRGTLSIASLPLYGSRVVSGWMASFSEAHPEVYLRVQAGPSEEIEAAILAGAVDLGFSFVPPLHSEISCRELFEDQLVIFVSKKHALASKKSLSFNDLRSLPMALPSERISAVRVLTRYFEENKVEPNVRMGMDDGHTIIELVKQSNFVTCLPLLAVKSDPDIRAIPLPEPTLRIKIGALWTQLSPASKAFLDLITEQAQEITAALPLLT